MEPVRFGPVLRDAGPLELIQLKNSCSYLRSCPLKRNENHSIFIVCEVLNCKTDQQKLNCIKKLHSNIIDMFSRFDYFITILSNCTVRNKQHDDKIVEI